MFLPSRSHSNVRERSAFENCAVGLSRNRALDNIERRIPGFAFERNRCQQFTQAREHSTGVVQLAIQTDSIAASRPSLGDFSSDPRPDIWKKEFHRLTLTRLVEGAIVKV